MKANAQLGEMHDRLIDFHMQSSKERFCDALLRLVEDPLTLVLALALGTFLLFSFVQL
jgi:hypothetical protein